METYQDWLNARQNAREAITDVERAGQVKASAEAAYYREKSLCVARLKADGVAATLIQLMVKGDDKVNEKLFEYRMAEAEYTAAKNAATLFIDEESHCFHNHRVALAGDSGRY